MFNVNDNKGFRITFSNGYSVSVQWGAGNYGGNYSLFSNNEWKYGDAVPASNTAETAVIAEDGEFVKIEGDEVQGYQSPDEVAALIAKVQSWPRKTV